MTAPLYPGERTLGLAIQAAEVAAERSPCAKSKRGVAIFDTRIKNSLGLLVVATGYNRPPANVACDGSPACRASCGKRCLHAESRALADLGVVGWPGELDLVHVKIGADGKVVPGGGPSCWQCAREVLDVGIGGVWLFEQTDCPSEDCPMCTGAACMHCSPKQHEHAIGPWHAMRAGLPFNGPRPPACDHDVIDRHDGAQPPQGTWKRYTAAEFWAATCAECEVHP